MEMDDLPADGKPETRTFPLAGQGVPDLAEPLEDRLDLFRRNADPGVFHLEDRLAALP